MNAAAEPQVAARRAALAVHALGEEDRAWMLAQLQPQQRAALEPLLGELRDLGIQADRRALDQIGDETVSPASAHTRLARLGRREMQALARMLAQEPPEVTRALLSAGDAAWRGALRKVLDPNFAVRVDRLPPQPPSAPALRTALAAAVERRLPEPQASTKRHGAWWKNWGSRWRST